MTAHELLLLNILASLSATTVDTVRILRAFNIKASTWVDLGWETNLIIEDFTDTETGYQVVVFCHPMRKLLIIVHIAETQMNLQTQEVRAAEFATKVCKGYGDYRCVHTGVGLGAVIASKLDGAVVFSPPSKLSIGSSICYVEPVFRAGQNGSWFLPVKKLEPRMQVVADLETHLRDETRKVFSLATSWKFDDATGVAHLDIAGNSIPSSIFSGDALRFLKRLSENYRTFFDVERFLNNEIEPRYSEIDRAAREQIIALLIQQPQRILCIVQRETITPVTLACLNRSSLASLVLCHVNSLAYTQEGVQFDKTVMLYSQCLAGKHAMQAKLPEGVILPAPMLQPYWVDMVCRLDLQGIKMKPISSKADLVSYWGRKKGIEAEQAMISELAFFARYYKLSVSTVDVPVNKQGLYASWDLFAQGGAGGNWQFVYGDVQAHFASLHLLQQMLDKSTAVASFQFVQENAKNTPFIELWPYLVANMFRSGSQYKSLWEAALKKILYAILKILLPSLQIEIINVAPNAWNKDYLFRLIDTHPELEMLATPATLRHARLSYEREKHAGHKTPQPLVAGSQLCFARAHGGFVEIAVPDTDKTRESYLLKSSLSEGDVYYTVALLPPVETTSITRGANFAALTYYLDCNV